MNSRRRGNPAHRLAAHNARTHARVGLAAACGVALVGGCGIKDAIDRSTDAQVEYLRKSKAAEAKVNLNSLARGAASAMEQEVIAPDGSFSTGRVPVVPAGPTPPLGTCCQGPGQKCMPDPAWWDREPWNRFAFALMDPHYFSYEFIPGPDGASFTFKAHGDLDCDGEAMVMSISGSWDPAVGAKIGPLVEPDTID